MKLSKIFSVAALGLLGGAVAAHAEPSWTNICSLIDTLGDVFRVLRTLCFAGAAFVLLGWGWQMIKDQKGLAGLDEAKTKGIGLLIGFGLLFGVGLVLQFLPGIVGNECNMNAFD
ncbi:MAG: hypothetical protein LBB08_02520 [Rickettsiales bacterium]|jgi:hypothetical protein|nr:hypothetical protein [Rickettsiales bacterium]